MKPGFAIRQALRTDRDAITALLPGLAGLDLPSHRDPEHLWRGDEALLLRWFAGEAPQSHVHVAIDDDNLLGLTIVTLRPELLSQEPSAHLEAIVVSERARGMGVGRALMENAESAVRRLGALSMSLHVFARNSGAREFYDRCGYDGELLRYTKQLIRG